ncbi:hypothetical protein [Lutibacter flavus]|uniref:Ubiquitin-like domain-containing protein n=1 Tax=Lutibacter flavus TaxID=691689 RepID=A0A238VND1_9FLAO|nr:hypothetical protein [Lutibacter flavus]SNR35865.1 hypothetical protein SAMN04488111_0780 [Lutibacter flavus]
MKKLIVFLVFMVLGTGGLIAQQKKQVKNQNHVQTHAQEQIQEQNQEQIQLQFQDGVLTVTLENGTSIQLLIDQDQTIDQIRDQLKLKDGSCKDDATLDLLADQTKLKIQARLKDGSCDDSSSLLQQILNLFNF